MPWLKATPVFKHGYGHERYIEVTDIALLDEVKSDFWTEHGDPEGIREPRWELHDHPPAGILKGEISSCRALISDTVVRMERLQAELDSLNQTK